jgi:hypothetical protein
MQPAGKCLQRAGNSGFPLIFSYATGTMAEKEYDNDYYKIFATDVPPGYRKP